VNRTHTHYSLAMQRRTLLLAVVFAVSCKKATPAGDLPPASDWQSKPAVPGATANPHAGQAGMPGQPAGPAKMSGGGNPHAGVAPEATAPKTPDKLPDGRLALGPFSVAAPADWTVKPVTSSMRAADFQLPAKAGAEAELIVYYFGPSGAGSVDDNLDRWLGQFQQPDGKKSRDVAKIENTKFAGQDATFVSVTGRFVAQAMPGATAAVDKQDQALLAAIVASPSGPYYFKLVGAKSTVDAGAAAFRAMLGSLKIR
jgi:hypothetical protein